MCGMKKTGRTDALHLERPAWSDDGGPITWSGPRRSGSTVMTLIVGDLEDNTAVVKA